MNQPEEKSADKAKSQPRVAPATDPTNPQRQESAGVFTPAERKGGSAGDEPGLTDKDREQRESGH